MIKLQLRPEARVLRQFAFLAVIGVALLTLFVLRLCGVFTWTHPAMLIAYGVGVLQLALFLAGIHVLTRVLFVAIMLLAAPIGFVISHVFLAIIFFLVVTPIGLVFRLLGRDVIGRKLDRDAKTYWVERNRPRPAASYFKLY